MSEVPLREHVDVLFRELKERLDMQAISSQRALDKAEHGLNDWKHSTNEFREQLREERSRYAPRELVESLERRLRAIEETAANTAGRLWAFGAVVTAITVAIHGLVFLLTIFKR